MSLCYDSEKWTMISLASIAISLTVGLVLMQYAYGETTYLNQTVYDHCLSLEDGDISDEEKDDCKLIATFENDTVSGEVFQTENDNDHDGISDSIDYYHGDKKLYKEDAALFFKCLHDYGQTSGFCFDIWLK